jgi:archaemetzincin
VTISRRDLLLASLSPALARAAAIATDTLDDDAIEKAVARIRPRFTKKKPAQAGDWLWENTEPGQTYAQFRAATPGRAIDAHSTLRIVPIGAFTEGQAEVLAVTKDFMRPFFGLPIEVDPPVPLDAITADAKRTFDPFGIPQLLTSYLRSSVLLPRRRATDAAVLGITAVDLWPGSGWAFVFGQASLTQRVGVWSMARNGQADGRRAERHLCAIRTAMTATHETGHMFGIRHCTAYECGMNGSNHSDERDRQPIEFCPECQPKLWWTLRLDPVERSRKLAAVARAHGYERLAPWFDGQTTALERPR